MVDNAKLSTFFAIENIVATFCDFYHIALIVGYLDESHLQHLKQIVLPVVGGQCFPDTERLQCIVAFPFDSRGGNTLQNFYNRSRANLFVGALDGTQSHLDIFRTIKALRRVVTHVTIVAIVVALLTEII